MAENELEMKIEEVSKKLGKPEGEAFVELMGKARPDKKLDYNVTEATSATRESGKVQIMTVQYGTDGSEELILRRYNAEIHVHPKDIRAAIEKGITEGKAAIDEIVGAVQDEGKESSKKGPTLKEKYEAVRDEIYLQFEGGVADPYLAHTTEPIHSWHHVLEKKVPIGLYQVKESINNSQISDNLAEYKDILFELINCVHQHINHALKEAEIGQVYAHSHCTPLGVPINYRLDSTHSKARPQG